MLSPTFVQPNSLIGPVPLDSALAAFRQVYPAYDTTWKLDELRATEYARLDRLGHVYLVVCQGRFDR